MSNKMDERKIKLTASIGLLIGGILGLAGSFAPTDSLRCIAWVIDGVGLTIACFILAIYYYRKGLGVTAIGFLVFGVGECFILSSTSIDLEEHTSTFGVGVSLWAMALFIISSQPTYPVFVRCTGWFTAVLFSIVSILIFTNHSLHPLTKPLPFYAYPFLVITIFGWVRTLLRKYPSKQGSSSPGGGFSCYFFHRQKSNQKV